MDWWVSNLAGSPSLLVSWILWVIGSIVLHELAHGWMAIRFGDTTPSDTGHMTWNPMVHMGGMSLFMFALIGIAWGQMPVNPRRFRGRHAEAWVSLAGPLMNLGLAIAAIVLGGLWMGLHEVDANGAGRTALYVNVANFFYFGAMLNLFLMGFNLLPIPPLDGSTVLASHWPPYRELMRNPNFGAIMLVVFILMFTRGAGYLFDWAGRIADGGIGRVASLFL